MSLDWNSDVITGLGNECIDPNVTGLDFDWSLQDVSWIDQEPGVGEGAGPCPEGEANDPDGNLPSEPLFNFLNFGLPLDPPIPPSDQQGGPAPPNNASEIEPDISTANEATGIHSMAASSNRKTKGRCPSAAAWSAQKANIKKLYIDDQETLDTTMKIMRETFNFHATRQMYKDKFSEWGFMKNVPRRLVGKLNRIANEREPKKTEFQFGPKTWTAEEIRRKCAGPNQGHVALPDESPPLPANLIIRTPSLSPGPQNMLARRTSGSIHESPRLVFHQEGSFPGRSFWSTISPSTTRHPTPPAWSSVVLDLSRPWRPWTPASNREQRPEFQSRPPPILPPLRRSNFPWQTTSDQSREPMAPPILPQSLSLASNWNLYSLGALHEMKSDAQKSLDDGRITQAIEGLREVVGGFANVLSPTHSFTVDAIYELSQLLAENAHMNEADSILNWLSSSMVKRSGLQDQKTVLHYVRVIHFLKSWSRHEDATVLMFRITEDWGSSTASHVPSIPSSKSGFATPTSFQNSDLKALVLEPQDEHETQAQLGLVEILLSSKVDSSINIEGTLQKLIESCSSRQLSRLNIQAHCCLARFYHEIRNTVKAMETLDQGLEIIEQCLTSRNDLPGLLLRRCRDLAFQYQYLNRTSKCDEALEIIAQILDRKATCSPSQHTAINFAISVGLQWQKGSSWEAAEPWFERAMAMSIRCRGSSHNQTLRLENALEKRQYEKAAGDLLESPQDLDIW